MLLTQAAYSFLRLGATEISLTVTEANAEAIGLYKQEGYEMRAQFRCRRVVRRAQPRDLTGLAVSNGNENRSRLEQGDES